MAGPWEKYAQQPQAEGPWMKYQSAQPEATGAAGPENRLENYANAVTGRLTKAGTGLIGLGLDAASGIGLLDPDVAQEAKNITSEGRQQFLQQMPTRPGVERFAGDIIANPTMFIPGGPVASAAAGGGIDAALEADPAASAAEKGKSAAIGTATGYATGKVVGKIAKPVKNALNPEQQRLARVAADEGIKLSAAQKTGSKGLGLMEAAFDNLPFTAGKQAAKSEKQLQQFTKAALAKAGIVADEATPEVLNKGYNEIGGTINRITSGAKMPIDDQFTGDVLKVIDEYAEVIDPLRRQQFDNIVNTITKGDALSGATYQKTRSQLGRMMKAAWNSDPNYANALEGLQDALDTAMERAMPADKVAALQEARRQYGSLKTIMKAAGAAGKDSTSGLLSPAALRTAVKTANPTGYALGRGDLNDLARVGNTFLKNSVPDSGTAGRTQMAQLLQGQIPLASSAGMAGYMATGGNPLGALAGGAASAVLPVGIQAVYNRPLVQSYLGNGVPLPPEVQAYLAKMLATQANNPLSQ